MLDNITKKTLDKEYKNAQGIRLFKGFKKIIDDYVNGYKTYEDIDKERSLLAPYINDNNINEDLNIGYNTILSMILNNGIKYNKAAIIKSIEE